MNLLSTIVSKTKVRENRTQHIFKAKFLQYLANWRSQRQERCILIWCRRINSSRIVACWQLIQYSVWLHVMKWKKNWEICGFISLDSQIQLWLPTRCQFQSFSFSYLTEKLLNLAITSTLCIFLDWFQLSSSNSHV